MDEPDSVDVLQIHGGDGDGADLVFDFNSQRIAISIFPSSSTHDQNQGSIQDRLINLLDRTASGNVDDNEHEELVDEILGVILDAGREIFNAQATPHMWPHMGRPNTPRDLHSVIYPPILHFQLLDTCGKAAIIPIAPSEAYTVSAGETGYDSAEEDELGIDTTLPCYSTKAILTVEMLGMLLVGS